MEEQRIFTPKCAGSTPATPTTPIVSGMDQTPAGEAEPDLAALERIEAELFAVERALEQIDEGVYTGFEGLPAPEPKAL